MSGHHGPIELGQHGRLPHGGGGGKFRYWRGITRIHRSPSRPRPSMRPTAAFINIHEHLI